MAGDFDLQEELKKLPDRPGVYLMHGQKDEVIYVGKAVVLKNRVRQYFQSSRGKSAKIQRMVSQITRFEYIVTDSELEALVLECNLIKEYEPRYNTMLKDGKSYPYICVTLTEDFPRIYSTRTNRSLRDQNRYFGPYTNLKAVRDTLKLLQQVYRIRTCRNLPDKPCLNYHMHLCDAPCAGKISKEEYRARVEDALLVLNGHYEKLKKSLQEEMFRASEELDFERAITLRDLIEGVTYISDQHQKITDLSGEDRDICALAFDEKDAVAVVLYVRDGKMIGRDHFHIGIAPGDERAQVVSSFLQQFYAGTPYIPREILASRLPSEEERKALEAFLSERRGSAVRILTPQRGKKEHLVEMARNNAEMILKQDREKILREEVRTKGAMKDLSEALGLYGLRRVEAYDISNISGFLSVASMIVFEDGRPKKNDYRKFRIKTVIGPDDYASMEEVLTRRLGNHQQDWTLPDLIMMDGGRGHVNVAEQVVERLGLDIPVVGMVKDDRHRTRGLYFHGEEVPMDLHGDLFALITRIQDEVHRFAIEYHRSLRSKESVHSLLDDIEGIGPKRRAALMREFGDIEAISKATVEELAKVPEINEPAAQAVYDFFRAKLAEKERPEVIE